MALTDAGLCLPHGRKGRPAVGLTGKPFRSVTYGCRGWRQPAA